MLFNNFFILTTVYLTSFLSKAQTSDLSIFSSSGQSEKINSMILEWSLGDIAITTINNSDIQITQGFLQPKKIHFKSDINNIEILIYPNPTSNKSFIDIKCTKPSDVDITLMDILGKVLFQKKMNGISIFTEIDLSPYANGTYLANFIFSDNQLNKTFKVIKY